MAINTTLESASTTAASNGPSGSDQRTLADDGLRQYLAFIKSLKTLATLASGTTVTPPSTANAFSVTGVTAITTIASTNSWDGRDIIFIFAGILTLTHGSNLILPGSANITTAVGDAAWMVQIASGQWRCVGYSRADGSWVVGTQASLTLTGNLSVQGNTTLGNGGADTTTTNGNITFNAPTAGATLTVSPVAAGGSAVTFPAASTSIDFTNTAAAVAQLNWFGASNFEFVGRNASSGWKLYTGNGNLCTTWSSAGQVTIAAPTSGDTLTLGQTGSAAVNVSQSLSGATVAITASNTSNTASSDTRAFLGVAGTSAGDPFIRLNISGTVDWSVGIDNSDSDSFKISKSSSLGTNDYLSVTTDGRLYGTALHNNAGAVTGTTNQYVASGTYQPSPTATTNVSAVSATTATCGKWIRVGNTVHVVCSLNVDPTAGGTCDLHFSLPIASTLGAATNLSGVGVGDTTTTNTCGIVTGDTGNNHARLTFIAGADLASRVWTITFSYEVL